MLMNNIPCPKETQLQHKAMVNKIEIIATAKSREKNYFKFNGEDPNILS